mmetsp:Transcript_22806/g.34543  ORF Transcript_22806/g.34543 Transcript_22806/m.34543 type:complete len:113 (+) Transcript_22806:251-589(+)
MSSEEMTKSNSSEMSRRTVVDKCEDREETPVQLRKGVRAQVESKVKEGSLLWSRVSGTHWFLGNAGRAKWTVAKGDEKLQQRGDPSTIDMEDCNLVQLQRREPVNVILFSNA